MAVVSVTPTDAGRSTQHWEVPPDNDLNQSPIPRGLRQYGSTVAIAALGAGDETSFGLTFTFPTAFNYLIKEVTLEFQSDDLTTEFQNIGTLQYRPAASSSLGDRSNYQLLADGASMLGATNSVQQYRPQGTWRHWINGPAGDTVLLFLADISGDTSTAGDISWTMKAWEFDINQCFKWPVNTPIPIISY